MGNGATDPPIGVVRGCPRHGKDGEHGQRLTARASSFELPELTIIVPAFNEATRLTRRVERLEAAVESGVLCARTTELIIVDDGSTDETGWRAEELLAATFQRLRVLRQHDNAGKGAAVRLGTAAASAPVVLFMDADLSVDPVEIPRLTKAIGSADVAIGSRAHAESVVVSDNRKRIVMGRTFNKMVTSLTRMPFCDTQCGFKAFRTPIARVLFHLMRAQRFAFDVEVLWLARRLRMEIAEVGVHWCDVGQSTVRNLADPMSMTRDLLAVCKRREWPNLPGLVIEPAPGERRRSQSRIVAELHKALGPNFPIVALSEKQTVALLPLCDPIEVQEVAASLRGLPTKLTVRERSVSFPELMDHAPFRWIDGPGEGLIVAGGDLGSLVIEPPTHGWESMRSDGHRAAVAQVRT